MHVLIHENLSYKNVKISNLRKQMMQLVIILPLIEQIFPMLHLQTKKNRYPNDRTYHSNICKMSYLFNFIFFRLITSRPNYFSTFLDNSFPVYTIRKNTFTKAHKFFKTFTMAAKMIKCQKPFKRDYVICGWASPMSFSNTSS